MTKKRVEFSGQLSLLNKEILEVITGLSMLTKLNKFTVWETNLLLAEISLCLFKFKEAYDSTVRALIEKYKPELFDIGNGNTNFNFKSPEERIEYLKELETINNKNIVIDLNKIPLSILKNDSPEMATILLLINPIVDKEK